MKSPSLDHWRTPSRWIARQSAGHNAALNRFGAWAVNTHSPIYRFSLLMTLLRVLLYLLFFLPLAALAQPAPGPDEAELRQQLKALAERKLTETELRSAQASLEEALGHVVGRTDSEAKLADLKKQLDQAPAQIEAARTALERQKSLPEPDPQRIQDLPLAELSRQLEEKTAQLSDSQRTLSDANSLLVTTRTVPERAQTEIAANQARMQIIDEALKSGQVANRALTPEAGAALAAEWHSLDRRNALRLLELSGASVLGDLGQVRRDLATLRIARLERELAALQAEISLHRSRESADAVAALSAQAGAVDRGGALAREIAANQRLSDYLLMSTERRNRLNQSNLQTRQVLDNLTEVSAVLDEQLSVLQGSLLLARILYEQKEALPKLSLDTGLADQIADTRLYQFEINQQRELLGDPAAAAERLLAEQPPGSIDDELRQSVSSLMTTRAELLERINRELNALLNESITLQLAQNQLQETAAKLSATLDERMFWIPSNRPIDVDWLLALPSALNAQLANMKVSSVLGELWVGLWARPLFFLPVLMLAMALWWRRSWLQGRLEAIAKEIGYVRTDSHFHTPVAILLSASLALPISLLLALGGLSLQLDARGQNVALGAALVEMAQAVLLFYTAYRMLDRGGVAEVHFRWSAEHIHFLRRLIAQLGMVVVAVVAVVAVAERQPKMLGQDVLGILILCSGYAWMAVLMGRLLSRDPRERQRTPLRLAVSLFLALMPIALIGAVLLGYYYTALKLTARLIDTLYLLVLWSVIEATLVRALAVAARRIDHQRAVVRREAAEREAEEGVDASRIAEAPRLAIEQINQQSLRLMRLALMGVFIVALYWVWADLLTVVSYLDRVVLYDYVSGAGESEAVVPISLRDLLAALVIATIATILARNLPGLLEVLVLSRMQLAQGSAYAITTLLSYLIMVIGVASALGTLGLSWNKLQWLVAALSVGLGFGLQEIFANFISGLIILFERPVRIGDTVTIGNLSGTVSRIQIRATTITDFDRKEIIVPNKTFVTGQLINWSLTDTVTRVTIKLGVSYDADLDTVRELLFKVADENERVLKDPAPLVFFLNFGASTLDHELRVHVRELADRNAAIDEINRRIVTLCREKGIDIAFNQVDVHVRSIAGQEALLQRTGFVPVATAHPASA